MTYVVKGIPDEDPNERMARLIERDADEVEQRDLLLDWRDKDLPIFAVLAWSERPAPDSESLPGSPFSSPWDTTTDPGAPLPRSVLGPSSPVSSTSAQPLPGGRAPTHEGTGVLP